MYVALLLMILEINNYDCFDKKQKNRLSERFQFLHLTIQHQMCKTLEQHVSFWFRKSERKFRLLVHAWVRVHYELIFLPIGLFFSSLTRI